VLQAETWSLSGGVHRWLKSRSTREERKPVTRNYKYNVSLFPKIKGLITAITNLLQQDYTALYPKRLSSLFKNAVHTSKKTPHFTMTKINWLLLFREIITVYYVNHMRHINKNCSSY
jgi:hypothetical protein